MIAQDSGTYTLSVMTNDVDDDLDPIDIQYVSPASHGDAVIAGSNIEYTPDANYCGTDSFTYIITDSLATSNTATVDITITCLDTNATLSAESTIKGVTITSFGTPNADIGSIVAGTVTLSLAQAADTSNDGSFVTEFIPLDPEATFIKTIKYRHSVGSADSFDEAPAYTSGALTGDDYLVVKVTAADGTTSLYYQFEIDIDGTETPQLITPTSSSIFAALPLPGGILQTVQYVLPEPMQPNSLTLTFTPGVGSPVVIQLADIPDNEIYTIQSITIDPSGGIELLADVVSTSADSIPFGTYTVTLSYIDLEGNPAATASATGVQIVGLPEVPTDLGPVTVVNNGTTTDNLQPTFTFTTSAYDPDVTIAYTIVIADDLPLNSHKVVEYTSEYGAHGTRSFTVGQAAAGGTYLVGGPDQELSAGTYYWSVMISTSDAINTIPAYGWDDGDDNAYAFVLAVSSTETPVATGGIVAPLPVVASQGSNLPSQTTPIPTPEPQKVELFLKNLRRGMDDPDVARLQHYLNTHGFPVATSGWGSLGQEATVFGPKNFKALVAFQKSVGLPATGYFGPMTRAYINSHNQ